MILCHLFALALYHAIILDSSFIVLDVPTQSVAEVALSDQIIDHVWDDYLYLATNRNLYKIDASGPTLIDKTLLPMRFNYLMLKGDDIILISTNEVIVLDRYNLAFKSGVGLEYGDHRPVVKDQSFVTIPVNHYIYLISDAGKQSIIRIIDLYSGRLVRKRRTNRIRSFHYDAGNRIFAALDSQNNILIFDPYMNEQHKIAIPVPANSISMHNDGLIVHTDQGMLLMDVEGAVIDFQPIAQTFTLNGFLALNHKAIIRIDSTTLRPEAWKANDQGIIKLYPHACSYHVIGTDSQDNYYLIDHESLRITRLRLKKTQLKRTAPRLAASDSLWYLQLGAFSNPDNALEEHIAFRQSGLPVFIDSTALYRIKLGGFLDKHSGLVIADKMNLQGWFVYEPILSKDQQEEFYVGADRYLIKDGIIKKEEP
jgi:hypothetical protein